MAESRTHSRRNLYIGLCLALSFGVLCFPIGNNEKYRTGPFHPDIMKTYQVENDFGRVWQAHIFSVTDDSMTEYEAPGRQYPWSQIARISLDGRVYYLNPKFPLRKGEKLASERQKWAGEERETVGGYLLLVLFSTLGLGH